MPGKHKNRKSYRDPNRQRGQHLDDRERAKILTAFYDWGHSKRAIARKYGLAESTVRACIKSGIWTPQKPAGRKPILTTQKR
ncbi:hypothetical protein K469DRAFT_208922 [Zopfia rhizophila CBS 207.26]|uniref:HTH psq-type domain-containing protein n=1 Tax=Zopfia rhizophila CBS 207.26 TaxID=1314779 RepID=A0A6A6DWV6_9PEZI|nr:hypothetical protein K469DRAFT_208922 [Zopfia rhizophila CBS 207.26]